MNSATVSQLKIKLHKKLIRYIENYLDKKTIESTNYKNGKDFEEVAKELKI